MLHRFCVALLAVALLSACSSGGGGAGSGSSGGPQPPVNQPPRITSPTTATLTENGNLSYQLTATDAEGPIILQAVEGPDGTLFRLATNGALTFAQLPNFEAPLDADRNNVYEVRLVVTDGNNVSTAQTLSVTVTDLPDRVQVRRVATGFSAVTSISGVPGSADLYVTQKTGEVFRVDSTTGAATPLFTVSGLSTDGFDGLLGLAPGYFPGDVLVTYVATSGDFRVQGYGRVGPLYQPQATPLFSIPLNGSLAPGGWIGIGPDGLWYVAVGEAVRQRDPPYAAQDPDDLSGKILRFARNPDPYAGIAPAFFRPAPGNPYLGGGGNAYVFALGFSGPANLFFSGPDALVASTNGRGARNGEVSRLRVPQDAGANFGAPFFEGTEAVNPGGPLNSVQPVINLPRLISDGPRRIGSISGGLVYGGTQPALAGQYLLGDGNPDPSNPPLYFSVAVNRLVEGQTISTGDLQHSTGDLVPDAGIIGWPTAFGTDSSGRSWFADNDGELFLIFP